MLPLLLDQGAGLLRLGKTLVIGTGQHGQRAGVRPLIALGCAPNLAVQYPVFGAGSADRAQQADDGRGPRAGYLQPDHRPERGLSMRLGLHQRGVGVVELEVIGPGPDSRRQSGAGRRGHLLGGRRVPLAWKKRGSA